MRVLGLFLSIVYLVIFPFGAGAHDKLAGVVASVKPAIVGIASYNPLRQPQAEILGTGFGVGDGRLIITNEHVIRPLLKEGTGLELIVLVGSGSSPDIRKVRLLETDAKHDLALLQIEGAPVPPLMLKAGREPVPEGSDIAITGFPLGPMLGLYPATHRGIISAVTPNVIPQRSARELDPIMVRRERFDVYQLDIVAYPGNSGSPVYMVETGEVVAVVNSAYIKDTKERSISSPSGISYAIPVKFVQQLLRRAKKSR